MKKLVTRSLVRQVVVVHELGSAVKRRRAARARTFTALRRIVVASIAACGVLILRGGPVTPGERRDATARQLLSRFAYEAFPQWAVDHIDEACPHSLAELEPIAGRLAIDPWDMPLEMRCGERVRGAYIRSAGPDRRFDTDDDISSNE